MRRFTAAAGTRTLNNLLFKPLLCVPYAYEPLRTVSSRSKKELLRFSATISNQFGPQYSLIAFLAILYYLDQAEKRENALSIEEKLILRRRDLAEAKTEQQSMNNVLWWGTSYATLESQKARIAALEAEVAGLEGLIRNKQSLPEEKNHNETQSHRPRY